MVDGFVRVGYIYLNGAAQRGTNSEKDCIMEFTIKSRKLNQEITFSRAGNYYIYVGLNGKSGSLGRQICEGVSLMGDTIGCRGENESKFKTICRRWYKTFVRNEARI